MSVTIEWDNEFKQWISDYFDDDGRKKNLDENHKDICGGCMGCVYNEYEMKQMFVYELKLDEFRQFKLKELCLDSTNQEYLQSTGHYGKPKDTICDDFCPTCELENRKLMYKFINETLTF